MQEIRHCRTASNSERRLPLDRGFEYNSHNSRRENQEYSDERIPLGYFITFRTYGTWLHGKLGSVDRFHNVYGEPRLPADQKRRQYNQRLLKQPPVKLNARARVKVRSAITEACRIRKWDLWVLSVQSNHVHTVVTGNCKPKRILNAFKANATRELRTAGYCHPERSPWAYKGSRRYLWNEEDMRKAIAYVLYEQGELPE